MNTNKTLTKEQIKEIIIHFGYSRNLSIDFTMEVLLDMVNTYMMEKSENPEKEKEELINITLGDHFIYSWQEWALLKEYCDPKEANYYAALDCFICDLNNCIDEIEAMEKPEIYYMKNDTGELLTYREMIEVFESEYDGNDPTNIFTYDEYFTKVIL